LRSQGKAIYPNLASQYNVRRWHLGVNREVNRAVHILVLWRPTRKDTLFRFSLSRVLAFYFRGVVGRDADCDGVSEGEKAEPGRKLSVTEVKWDEI